MKERKTTKEWAATHAIKGDSAKPRMELLPLQTLEQVALVLGHGAQKYGDHNWRKGFHWTRMVGALLRHISAWMTGEFLDPESGLPHLAHAACNILFLIEHQMFNLGEDDRWLPPAEENAKSDAPHYTFNINPVGINGDWDWGWRKYGER